MRFTVGPWVYRVRICAGKLFEDGVEVNAVSHERIIHISGDLPAGERLRTLIDQLRRIHEMLYGQMTSVGVATFTEDFTKQIRSQGDAIALMRLTSDGWLDSGGDDNTAAEHVGCECGTCGTRYGSHQISTSAPAFDARFDKMVVRRAVECEFCGRVMAWTEGATSAGNPNGRIYSGPTYTRPTRGVF